jgi:8-oxo-dGTP diphosphatase
VTSSPKHSVSVAGVIVDDHERVLVIKRRDNGHWEPPGGVLELDESIEGGLRREVFEETGINIEVVGLSGAYKNMTRGIVALVFLCKPLSGESTLSSEAAEVRWLPVDEAVALMDEAYGVRVRDAVAGGVQVRAHDGVRLLLA